jgi:hypothetical protein
MQSRLERLAPLTGIVFLVLWIVGFVIAAADSPDFVDAPRENLEYYIDEKSSIMAGALLSMIALVFLLWFLGSIRRQLLLAEGGDGRVTAISFAGGVVGVGLLLGAMAAFVLPALRLDEQDRLSAENATVFTDLGNGLFGIAAPIGFGVMLLALALVGFRHGAVPKWWAVISVLLGLVMIIPFVSWAGMGFGFPIWVLVMVILLMRGGAREGAGTVREPVARDGAAL